MLAQCPALAHLHLRHNQIGDQGAVQEVLQPAVCTDPPSCPKSRGGEGEREREGFSGFCPAEFGMGRLSEHDQISYFLRGLIGNRDSETVKIEDLAL